MDPTIAGPGTAYVSTYSFRLFPDDQLKFQRTQTRQFKSSVAKYRNDCVTGISNLRRVNAHLNVHIIKENAEKCRLYFI